MCCICFSRLHDSPTFFLPPGSGTYTTSSLTTKTTTASDPPNICKVKPQQLQGGSLSSSNSSSSSNSFSQLGCVPPLLPQQQQTPQVYVSQSAAGEMDNRALTVDIILHVDDLQGEDPLHKYWPILVFHTPSKMCFKCCQGLHKIDTRSVSIFFSRFCSSDSSFLYGH